MFRSATIRLTGWYLFILMLLSLVFSLVIYQITVSEIDFRLNRLQTNLVENQNLSSPRMSGMNEFRDEQLEKARLNISIELFYVNLVVLVLGGIGSYYLARQSILPIEKAHESQSRFTSDASHELRTPLAVMKTEIEVALRDKAITNDELKNILSSNLEEIDKLSKLSEMLLNLSRLDHDKLELKTINISKITRNVIKSLKLPTKRVIITAKDRINIVGNEIAIYELIRVLVENALQYSPKESLVSISITKQKTSLTFEITNTGPGISSDKLPHIFERFYRADSSRTNGEGKGFGLGLSIAKNIVEIHGGEIEATSIPDRATTIVFKLPIL